MRRADSETRRALRNLGYGFLIGIAVIGGLLVLDLLIGCAAHSTDVAMLGRS